MWLFLFRDNSSDLTMIIGAMYAAVIFVGINNCQTVQPIVAVERTVFYRERAAGMYAPLPYALAQVGGLVYHKEQWYLFLVIMFLPCVIYHCANAFAIAGFCRNTLCICPSCVLLTPNLCHGELWMESGEVLLVLLCQLLLFLVLHILWYDDCFHHTKPPSGINLCSSILWTIQSLLWFLYPKTSEYPSSFYLNS